MRCGILLAALWVGGCVSCPPAAQLVTPTQRASVAELVARHPIDAGANIRADEIDRTPGGSVHLVQVRKGESPHRHERHDLVITVISGAGVLNLGDEQRPLRARDVAVVPRGMVHWFVNTGSSVAVALVTFTPPLDAPDSVPVER
jgi:quercetin dioxygenase-like cupin family protein